MYNLQPRSTVADVRREISLNEPVEELGLSPQRSEEEKSSEASSAEEESGDEEIGQDSLEFLISGKRIEEVFIFHSGLSEQMCVKIACQLRGSKHIMPPKNICDSNKYMVPVVYNVWWIYKQCSLCASSAADITFRGAIELP